MKFAKTLMYSAVAGALISTSVAASEATTSELSNWDENAWVTLSGEIQKVNPGSFVLKTGDNDVTVEFDDGDYDADALIFKQGDRVSVSGKVDKNLMTETTLEASSVFVHQLSTTFIADATDEESEGWLMASATVPTNIDDMTLIGTVNEVNEDVIELDTAGMTVSVDTSELPGEPFKQDGLLYIEEGDRIKVDASMDGDFFDESLIVADVIVRMNNAESDEY
ncbi:OB-fold nucleic acid binding domain-containing protein [Alteromonas sp. H39]|uniref:OB-fold nucleic acid binding domain-containing protein n=1 Tax=Alteromonas sp. H39 TaxID=3389876 RepID=UPI0039DFC3B8